MKEVSPPKRSVSPRAMVSKISGGYSCPSLSQTGSRIWMRYIDASTSGEHVGGDAGIPAGRFFVVRLPHRRRVVGLRDEAVDLLDLLRRRLVIATDLHAVTRI